MKRSPFIFFMTLILPLVLCAQKNQAQKKINVLIVDGFSNHDWRLTTKILKAIMEPTGLFSVSVSTAPSSLKDTAAWGRWKPNFNSFDVVVQTCNNLDTEIDWPASVKQSFEQYVKNGGGVYILHAANNSFLNWEAYNEIIGLGWRKKSYGTALYIDSLKKIKRIAPGEGENTGHDRRVDAQITRLGEHPIHKGMPQKWVAADVEIYQYVRGPAKNIDILSYAYDAPTKMNWPMEWTVQYGKGNVYVTSFGHVWEGDVQPVTMRCAGFQTVFVRALLWLAKSKVTFPVPADFPGTEHTSIRSEFLINE